jgi:hypothetical protein
MQIHGASSAPADEPRLALSTEVNRFTERLLSRLSAPRPTVHGSYDMVLALRRFQLFYLERALVARLDAGREPERAPVRVDLAGLPSPSGSRRLRLFARLRNALARRFRAALFSPRATVLFNKISSEIRIQRLLGRKPPPPRAGVRRLVFLDGGEVMTSSIGGRRYVYHRHLDGLVDLDRMEIADDTLLVLYGNLRFLDERRLLHPRVVCLSAFEEVPGRREDLVARAIATSVLEAAEMSPELREAMAGCGVRLEDLVRYDFRIVTAAARLLAGFDLGLEIVLDNYDSTLFTLAQYILEQTPHEVIALQKVLGPYTLSYNLHETRFHPPTRMVGWADFHREVLGGLGYRGPFESRGMFKLTRYAGLAAEGRIPARDDVRRRMDIPLDRPLVMFSPVQRILGYPLIDPAAFVAMFVDLAALAERCYILLKPWPGEDPGPLLELATGFLPSGGWQLVDAARAGRHHNVELLRASDVLVSTMSSFLGEAAFFGCLPVLVVSEASTAYFSPAYVRSFQDICLTGGAAGTAAERPFRAVLEDALAMSRAERAAWFERIAPRFAHMFGVPPARIVD